MIGRYALLGGAHLVASGFGFLATLVIATRFGPAGFGEIALALSVAEYAVLIAGFGTPLYAVTRIAAAPRRAGRLAADVMAVRALAGMAAYGVLVLLFFAVPRLAAVRGLGLAAGLLALVAAANLVFVAQALDRTSVLAATSVVTQAGYLTVLTASLALVGRPEAAVWSKVAAEALIAGGLLVWMVRRVQPLRSPSPPAALARLAGDAAPIGASNVLRHMTHASDVLLVGLLVSPAELGHYAAAARIALFVSAMSGPYFVLLLPRLCAAAMTPDGLGRVLARSRRLALPAAAAGTLVLVVAAGPILQLFFGAPFADAGATPLRLLALAFFVGFAGRHERQVLLALQRQRSDFAATALAAVCHVAAKLALIAPFGIAGAALGAVIGNLVLLVLLAHAARRAVAEESLADRERLGSTI